MVKHVDQEQEDAMRRTEDLCTVVDKLQQEKTLDSKTLDDLLATLEQTGEMLTRESADV